MLFPHPAEAMAPEIRVEEAPKITVELTTKEKVLLAINDRRIIPTIECESHFQQFRNGKPLISKTHDVGVMQINLKTHAKEAELLGLDIYHSIDDNIAMGKIIYERQGIGAWTCSRKTWKKSNPPVQTQLSLATSVTQQTQLNVTVASSSTTQVINTLIDTSIKL